jgi:hypothetical protein
LQTDSMLAGQPLGVCGSQQHRPSAALCSANADGRKHKGMGSASSGKLISGGSPGLHYEAAMARLVGRSTPPHLHLPKEDVHAAVAHALQLLQQRTLLRTAGAAGISTAAHTAYCAYAFGGRASSGPSTLPQALPCTSQLPDAVRQDSMLHLARTWRSHLAQPPAAGQPPGSQAAKPFGAATWQPAGTATWTLTCAGLWLAASRSLVRSPPYSASTARASSTRKEAVFSSAGAASDTVCIADTA